MADMPKIKSITHRPIIQIGWMVNNLESAMLHWVDLMGAGPFFLMPHVKVELTYRGNPSTPELSSAFGQWGSVQVELIQQHCDSPSPMREMFTSSETGIQHMSWFADDFDAENLRLYDLGFPAVLTMTERSLDDEMRIAMFDTRPLLGVMVEVYEENKGMRQFYHQVAQAAKDWKGENPIREFSKLGG